MVRKFIIVPYNIGMALGFIKKNLFNLIFCCFLQIKNLTPSSLKCSKGSSCNCCITGGLPGVF